MDESQCDVYAVSIGNIAALGLLLGEKPSDLVETAQEFLRLLHVSTPAIGFCGSLDSLRVSLDAWLPHDIHQRVGDRYHVMVNAWPSAGFREVTRFPTKAALLEAVIVSCFFPGFVWRPYCLNPCAPVFDSAAVGESSCTCCTAWVCVMDGGCQNILTPADPTMDLMVRPLPVTSCAMYEEENVVQVTDAAALAIGHKVQFVTSLIPTGSAVWDGKRPLPPHMIRSQLEAAATDASNSKAIRDAFAPWARSKLTSTSGVEKRMGQARSGEECTVRCDEKPPGQVSCI